MICNEKLDFGLNQGLLSRLIFEEFVFQKITKEGVHFQFVSGSARHSSLLLKDN